MVLLCPDVLLHLCDHLDLETMSTFLVALPQFEPLVLRSIRNKRYAIKVVSEQSKM